MMSDVDPEKLKVAELRDELKARGLDTKGNKAALVIRLKEAMTAEGENEAPEEEEEAVEAQEEEEEAAPEEELPAEEEQPMEEPVAEEEEDAAEAEEPVEEILQEETEEAAPVEEEEEPAQAEEEETEAMKEDAAVDEENHNAEEVNGDEEEEQVVLGDEFRTIDEATQDDTEEGNIDKKRKRSRSPRDRNSPRDRHRHGDSRDSRYRRRSPPPRKVEMDKTDWESLTTFVLDRYDADLNLRFDENGIKAHPLTVDGFAYMWSGVRAMYGVRTGKVAYEVKVLENLNVEHLQRDGNELNPHVLRVGWSVNTASLNLGEEEFSYGYGGTGKASTECKFENFGEKFSSGDVITAYLDLESDPVVLSYSKNGEDLGNCFEVEKEKLGDQALFPHLMTKNVEFECNFGAREGPYFPLKEGFKFLETIPQEERIRGHTPAATKEECEVIMMVGLPGAGKTYWVDNFVKESEKKYWVLGTNNIIDKMKVMGLPRKQNYNGRWDVLIDKASKCLNRLIEIAARKKRNYIIDQTNVYASARRRKMQPFEGFQRKAVVVLPTDEEFKKRVKERVDEEGKDIPDSAVLEMKANFTLPEAGEEQVFETVEFAEETPEKEEREKLVETYRKDGRDALPPPNKRFRRDNRFSNRDFRGERSSGWRGDWGKSRDSGYRGGRGSFRPYDRRGGSGGYRGGRDDRRRDDRRYGGSAGGGGYKGARGGYGGGGYGGGGYHDSWRNQGGYNQGWGSSYNQGWGRGGYGGSYNQGWGSYNNNWGGYGYR